MTEQSVSQNLRVGQFPNAVVARPNGQAVEQTAESAGAIAVAFLKAFDAEGAHNLVALDPAKKRPVGRTFQAGAWDEIAEWVDERDGRLNLYFSANEPAPGAPHEKLSKADIGKIRAVYADIDPAAGAPLDFERERLRGVAASLGRGAVPPTFVIDSGSGIQPIWRLATKLEAEPNARAAEDQGRGVAAVCGGDSVQNIDRILRLPGTMNLPDAAKRAKGRIERRASLITRSDKSYSLESLAVSIPPMTAHPGSDRSEVIEATMRDLDMRSICGAVTFDDLDEELRSRFMAACAKDPKLDRLWRTGDPELLGDDKSGSAYRAALAVHMGRSGGFKAQDYGELAWIWDYSVRSEHERGEKLNARTIARDWERIAVPVSPDAIASQHYERVSENPAADVLAKRALRYTDFTTLLKEEVVEEPDYIEDGFAGPGNFVLIAGPPKAQKSFLVQEILVAAATGGSFLNTFRVPRPLRVFYLQAEMNRKLLRKRARVMSSLSSADIKLLAKNLIVSERFHMILDEQGVAAAVQMIREAFPNEPPDIIAIDPLANVFDKDNENDNTQLMQFLVGRIERLRQLVNPAAAVVMVHHTAKKSVEDFAKEPFAAIRGGGALRGYYDSAIVIYRKSEDGKARRVHFELRSGESPPPMDVELVGGRFQRTSTAPRLPQRREAIARSVLGVMGGRKCALLKDVQVQIGAALQDAGVSSGVSRQIIQQHVTVALSNGVELDFGGRSVSVKAEKNGAGEKAPWQIVVSDILSGADEPGDASHASDASGSVFA